MDSKTYAAVIMRAQPLHVAHIEIIQHMIDDGYAPLVILGSANSTDKERNPYSYEQRDKMLEDVFPGIMTAPLNDYYDWDTWIVDIRNIMDSYDSTVLYTFNKEEDRYKSFEANGKIYTDAYFSDAICDSGVAIININYTSYPELHARNIRSDIEGWRHYLRFSTYKFIKELE